MLRAAVEALGGEQAPEFERFAALFGTRLLEKGSFFVREGDNAQHLAFVCEGIARMFYTRADGKEYNKGFIRASGFMSALEALITGEPTRLSVQALTPMRVLVAEYAQVSAFFERHMFWQRVGRRSVERVYVRKVQREASLLMDSAAERYAAFRRDYRDAADPACVGVAEASPGHQPDRTARSSGRAPAPLPGTDRARRTTCDGRPDRSRATAVVDQQLGREQSPPWA